MTATDSTIADSFDIGTIEQQVSLYGHFCLLEWMMGQEILSYAAYEDWRNGRLDYVDKSLLLSGDSLKTLIQKTEWHCIELGLVSEVQLYFQWNGGTDEPLSASDSLVAHVAITQRWVRTQDSPQLDLFMDGAANLAENEVRANLAAREFSLAQRNLNRLIDLDSGNTALGAYQDLINYGSHMQTNIPIGIDQIALEMQGLENEVQPLARETLARDARDYLAFAWRRLSQSLEGERFIPGQARVHSSYALMQIPDWAAACQSLQQEPALYESFELLERLAICHQHMQNMVESLLVWCLLFELDCDAAVKAVESKQSEQLWSMWQDYWEVCEEGENQYFPAFVLAMNSGLIHHLDQFPPLQSNTNQAMIALLKAQLDKEDDRPEREKLHALSPAVWQMYKKIRIPDAWS